MNKFDLSVAERVLSYVCHCSAFSLENRISSLTDSRPFPEISGVCGLNLHILSPAGAKCYSLG